MNIYQTVTDRILAQLADGVIPWRKTWITRLPKSLTTGKEYRGVNILVLSLAGFSSRYWISHPPGPARQCARALRGTLPRRAELRCKFLSCTNRRRRKLPRGDRFAIGSRPHFNTPAP